MAPRLLLVDSVFVQDPICLALRLQKMFDLLRTIDVLVANIWLLCTASGFKNLLLGQPYIRKRWW